MEMVAIVYYALLLPFFFYNNVLFVFESRDIGRNVSEMCTAVAVLLIKY